MQKKPERKVFAYCNEHRMFQKGDRVVLGVSGGADSVCLLFLLLEMRKELDLELYVVHVNHGIRQDAAADADYVKELCETNHVSFHLVEENIPMLARQWNMSEEEAGRKVRYESFEKVFKEQQATKIAVAHNANDSAETMLFHMFRGTGLTGLCGIRPVREHIVRPILCLERAEIEAYLAKREIAYRHDSTNDSDDYTRNKIRHHILKYAEEEIVDGSVGNMSRTADILAETENYIEEQVTAARKECVSTSSVQPGEIVNADAYLQLHSVIQKRLILCILKELSPMHKDIGAVHVKDVHSLFVQSKNRCIHLPYGIRAKRQYDAVILERSSEDVQELYPESKWEPINIELDLQGEGEVSFRIGENKRIALQVLSVTQNGINCKDIPQNQYTKWFDYDKMKERLTFRTRRTGDYLCIKGPEGMQRKKLKDYMIAEKIPREHRDSLPVLAADNHVVWLPGYRISEYYKVEENTKNILQVCYIDEEV